MWGWDGWWGHGFGGFWNVILGIFWGVGQLLALLIFVGVLFLLVRFLLVATRAAHLYIARNGPPAATVAETAPPTRPAPATRPAAATTARTAPTKRTPKPPTP